MTDSIHTVLFDLDGTLLDTAADLAEALNHTLEQHGKERLPFEAIRPHVSHGGQALVKLGFGLLPDDEGFNEIKQEFLDYYLENIATHSRLFDGMEELLSTLENSGISWGVVTNKPAWLTDPLMQALGLDKRAACIVSGDTLKQRKPDPEPLLHACQLTGSKAGQCLYVGDAQRDIEAGNRAGMTTLVALFGYIMEDDDPQQWQADGFIDHPAETLAYIPDLQAQ